MYPNSLKIARVVPIFKEDNKFELSNYRPISILSILSKMYEKMHIINYTDALKSITFSQLINSDFGKKIYY